MRSPAHLVFTRRCGLARSGPGTEPVQADSRVTHTASLEGRPSSVVYGASSPNRAALTRRRNRPGQRALAFSVTLPLRSKAPAGSHWPAGRAAPRGAFGNTRGRWAPAGVWSVWVSWVASRAGGGPVGGMPRSPCQETRRPSPVRRDAGRPIQAAPVDLGASSPERGGKPPFAPKATRWPPSVRPQGPAGLTRYDSGSKRTGAPDISRAPFRTQHECAT